MSTIETLEPRCAAGARRRPRAASAATRWERPALGALLALTALAYLWGLSASGDANSFYAAAVQAATHSWTAFFFGSLDSSSFITVDKPPASLWVMALSGRIFGFSSWSMLVPQALEGVAAVGFLYAAVRRWFGPAAGLGAGAVLALTPVAALMFRFNNPDALLVMLLVASACTLTRALEAGRTRWLVATGALIGFAFLAKMGQAFLVVPGFGLAYLVAAPTSLRRRLGALLAGFAAMIAAGGWWVAIVELLPASSRPFIDGSPSNDILNLIFGYNGLSRLFGGGAAGGGGGGGNFSGSAGTLRLFNDLMGGQASWLMPAALIALAAGLWATRRAPRTDRTRAALIAWGGWLLVTAAVFSYSQGVIHTYYAVALAPAIGALVAIGAAGAWRHRDLLRARAVVAATIALSGAWSYVLLDRTPGWQPWLRTVVVVAGVVAALGWLAAPALARRGRRALPALVVASAIAALAGPAAYTIDTITTAHSGSVPSAGPTLVSATGGPGGLAGGATGASGLPSRGSGGPPSGGSGAIRPAGAPAGSGAPPSATGSARGTRAGSFPSGAGTGTAGVAGGVAGVAGGGGARVASALVSALERNASSFRWVAATLGSNSAANYELATGGDPVMAIGGFNGNGGNLTLAQFIRYVRAGEIHYFIASGGMGGNSGTSSQFEAWVQAHYTARTIGGVTVYGLTSAAEAAGTRRRPRPGTRRRLRSRPRRAPRGPPRAPTDPQCPERAGPRGPLPGAQPVARPARGTARAPPRARGRSRRARARALRGRDGARRDRDPRDRVLHDAAPRRAAALPAALLADGRHRAAGRGRLGRARLARRAARRRRALPVLLRTADDGRADRHRRPRRALPAGQPDRPAQ